MTRLAIAINLDRCVGCHTCTLACKMQNNVPEGLLWNRVLTENCDVVDGAEGVYPAVTRTYLPVACQHCQNAACQRVCPTGATYKDEKGRIEIDYQKCIGCRMCMGACPYTGVRSFNWEEPQHVIDFPVGDAEVPEHQKHVVEKCTMCWHRLAKGEQPMCVTTCLARARFWGDLDDPSSEVATLVRERSSKQLLAEEGTNPSVYYLV